MDAPSAAPVQQQPETSETPAWPPSHPQLLQMAMNGHPHMSHPAVHDIVCSHLYHNGFLQGLYTDLSVRIQADQPHDAKLPADGLVFNLHRIIAVRSPVIAAILSEQDAAGESQLPKTIALATNDPNLTAQGLSIAFGHLYGSFGHVALVRKPHVAHDASAVDLARSALLRSVLASAHFLGLPDLVAIVSDLIKEDISAATVLEYCHFVSSENLARYGGPITALREIVFAFLCRGIVAEISDRFGPIWPHKEGDAYQTLVRTFSGLSFEWFKRVVESKSFEVPNDMERFSFAKQIVELRARPRSTQSAAQVLPGEENVLLSFGGSKPGASGVTIVRKAPKLPMQPPQISQAIHLHVQHHQQQQQLHLAAQRYHHQQFDHHQQSPSSIHSLSHNHMHSQQSQASAAQHQQTQPQQQQQSHVQQQDQGLHEHVMTTHSLVSTSIAQHQQQHAVVSVGGMAAAGISVMHGGIMHMQQPERRVWKAGH